MRGLLLQNMSSFVWFLTQEAGKTVSNAEGEVKATAERLQLTPKGHSGRRQVPQIVLGLFRHLSLTHSQGMKCCVR